MAEINVGVNKTNDPSYLNSSQGTDRASLQPLAKDVDLNLKIYQPDYKANTSAGQAIKGIGDIFEAGVKLTDQVITKKASDTLTKGIDEIRDSFGVAAAADQSTGIARAVAAGGAEGVAPANDKAPQPVAINRLGNKVEGLTEAYRQGGLSNSAYYAKLEAFVRETKAQFPGYNEQIDQIVSSKVGTTPANALRASLLNDVEALQRKVGASADAFSKYETAKADIIHQPHLWPNYEQLKAEGRAPSPDEIRLKVGQYEASIAQMDYKLKRIAVGDAGNRLIQEETYEVGLQKASEVSRQTVLGITNNMGIKNVSDLRAYVEDVRSGRRKEPTPDELGQLTSMGAILEQRVHAQMEQFGNTKINDKGETYVSRLRDPQKWAQLKEVAVGDVKTMIDGIVKGEHSLVASTAAWVKANEAQADKRMSMNMPNGDIVTQVRKRFGENALAEMISRDKVFASDTMTVLEQAGWVSMSKGEPAEQVVSKLSADDPSGVASWRYIKQSAATVANVDKLADKTVADGAFKSLFGPGNDTLMARAGTISHAAQVGMFTDMVSPQMTAAVAKRSKADQTMYAEWATNSFASLFETQAREVNQTAQNFKINGNLTLKFNPASNNFEYEGSFRSPAGIVANANKRLQGLNSAINSMKDVFKLQGKEPIAELYRLLPIAGLEGGTPAYKALQDEYMKTQEQPGK